jgi:multidrug efflux pump
MKFIQLFLDRPIATSLMAVSILLTGLLGYFLLPVSALPQVDFPTISIEANFPGASPENMATAIATPLERTLGNIAGISEITSMSSLNSTRITLQFDLDRDINGAARDVQAAINAARTLLPSNLPSNPTYHKVNPSDSPIIVLSLSSKDAPQATLYEYASTVVAQKLSQIEGVGQVSIAGSSAPAVRVELNPLVVFQHGINLQTVSSAISSTNANRPKGFIEDHEQYWQIDANDQVKKAKDYDPLIVTYKNGAAVKLSDIGQVVDGIQDVRNLGLVNGKSSVLVLVRRLPNANVIETSDRIKAELPSLRESVPASVDIHVVTDRTPTIRASVHDIEISLVISVLLVILVVLFFLRKMSATLIPSVVVPLSLIGTCGVMYLLGYSLDNLSLMALTIAAGFVVDDAIVVLENITRHIESGVSVVKAAMMGTQEVMFTVISMSASLVAVFIPILFMGGIVGRLFREFAATLSIAVLISLLISVTVTPVMCSKLLKEQEAHHPNWLQKKIEAFFNVLQTGYKDSLQFMLKHSVVTLLILMATVILNVYLYMIVPKGFFPQQDTGRISGAIQADQGISYQLMEKKLSSYMQILNQDPAIENVAGFVGGGQRNTGFIFASLKPLAQRKVVAQTVIDRLRPKLSHVAGARLFLQADQDIRMGGRQGNAQYQYTIQGNDLEELRKWEPKIKEAFMKIPALTDVNSDRQDKGVQTKLVIDRDTASRLGINFNTIDQTLNGLFGQRMVSTIYSSMNQYYVIMEAAPEFLESPDTLKSIYMVNTQGNQIPLSSFSHFEQNFGALAVNHQGQLAATTITFNLKHGYSLSDATLGINNAFEKLGVPVSIQGDFQGTAKVFQASLKNQPYLILAAILAVYVVLGILYESYIHPLTILSTLPSAGVGALLALSVFDMEFNFMGMIGVILLIGIVKKNAIMMIDFAIQTERKEGVSSKEAIYQACLIRFRPILMTTMAALLGALPLTLSLGEGFELRQTLGISIVGGLLLSQLLTLYTTPVVYLYLDRLSIWVKAQFGKKIHGIAQ